MYAFVRFSTWIAVIPATDSREIRWKIAVLQLDHGRVSNDILLAKSRVWVVDIVIAVSNWFSTQVQHYREPAMRQTRSAFQFIEDPLENRKGGAHGNLCLSENWIEGLIQFLWKGFQHCTAVVSEQKSMVILIDTKWRQRSQALGNIQMAPSRLHLVNMYSVRLYSGQNSA